MNDSSFANQFIVLGIQFRPQFDTTKQMNSYLGMSKCRNLHSHSNQISKTFNVIWLQATHRLFALNGQLMQSNLIRNPTRNMTNQ